MGRQAAAFLLVVAVGCGGGDLGTRRDAGSADARAADASAADTGIPDASASDAAPDAPEDAGTGPDAGADAGADAGMPDAGIVCRPEPRDCSPAPVTHEDYCIDARSCYLRDVQAAVRGVISDHPEWFDASGSCSIILDVDSFMDDVVARIVARGVCAIRDPNAPNEEVTLKYSNVFTENFDIVASTGCARTGDPIYTSTCFPAWW